ncbi:MULTISPECIES: HNH endonuclease family protein [unclassified Streptomyces]|uniref:HNH endonuclease family protein n=1 Tax=unclassified Streptomyces TaxID=2593676 RepID=UPI002E0D16C0|nr:HNH endonuclease family protein [Streptomyces sp. NBC_01197]WSS48858.1 HNH endonuclease family protein [Streptomyces sp. NBC_01180]
MSGASGVSSVYARRIAVLTATAGITLAGLVTAPSAQAALPTPVSAATARTYLSSLTVAAEGSSDGYSRDKFPHWITQSGACDTREVVLKRDGTNVVQSSTCAATSGSWYSEYDGATWTASSDVDIDHMVPLAEAWRSGASSWTTAQRQAYANDLTRPQLIAVTDNVNQSKGDKDPAEWLPPRAAYKCTYVRAWVEVKHYYKLTVDSAEKTALQGVLNGC